MNTKKNESKQRRYHKKKKNWKLNERIRGSERPKVWEQIGLARTNTIAFALEYLHKRTHAFLSFMFDREEAKNATKYLLFVWMNEWMNEKKGENHSHCPNEEVFVIHVKVDWLERVTVWTNIGNGERERERERE